MQIRILVADDAKFIRAAIRRVVEFRDEFVVCAEASDGAEAVAKALEWCPDVVVMDIRMPVMNGIDAAKILADKCPHTLVIADSVHAYTENFPDLQRNGVKGFALLLTCERAPVRDEIQRVWRSRLDGRREQNSLAVGGNVQTQRRKVARLAVVHTGNRFTTECGLDLRNFP